MEHMVRRASIEGVSAALGLSGLSRPTAPPAKPVKKVQFGGVEEKLFSFDWYVVPLRFGACNSNSARRDLSLMDLLQGPRR